MDGAGADPLAARDPREGIASHGRAVPRGQDLGPGGESPGRRFGWMFTDPSQRRRLADATDDLVEWMARDHPARRADNTAILAGFTYLGQFIDHDITFDPMSKLDRPNDPRTLVNFRTPRLDLDSVYGSGPEDQPFLYDWKRTRPPGRKLLLAENPADATAGGEPLAREDLPRNQQGRALIGDPRNDENVILTQLHLLFIRFHNAVVDRITDAGDVPEDEVFDRAQEMVRWHYQWIVVNEFLPLVAGAEATERALADQPHFKWKEEGPFIPFEFSLAAYRFGHSMVRSDYLMQRAAPRGTPLFPDLSGFRWLPARLAIDWELFFELPGAGVEPQASQLINTTIVKPLWTLPETGQALPQLTLERGRDRRLPSGQQVADAMGARAIPADELSFDGEVAEGARRVLSEQTPLWFYILSEAELEASDGEHLGPVGAGIVAEVLIGLLMADPNSYLGRDPGWRPTLGRGGEFWMSDLIDIARRPA